MITDEKVRYKQKIEQAHKIQLQNFIKIRTKAVIFNFNCLKGAVISAEDKHL